jgi:hypothetical protein
MQDNSQQTVVVKPKPNRSNRTWYIAAAVVAGGILICLAYFAGVGSNAGKSQAPAVQTPAASKPQSNTPQQTTTPVSTPSNPPITQPPAQTPTPTASNPPSTPVTTPPQQTPSQPSNPPAASTTSSGLIMKQAYTMTLTLDDMGAGWIPGNAGSPGKPQIFSSSHVTFTKGSSFSPVVQNTVEVYRTVDAAITAYQAEKPANAATLSLSYPSIGDECFLNDTVATNKTLVFRKNNVVVWIMTQQDKTSDPVHYAQIVEQKVTP